MKATVKIMASCMAILVIFLCATQPDRLPSAILILPFVLMFIVLTLLIALVIGFQQGGIALKTIRAGCIAATLPILLLILQSVGQLTLRDALTLFALFGITYFYMSKVNVVAR
jgi:hypothetical protein